jgi:hypothetical protein
VQQLTQQQLQQQEAPQGVAQEAEEVLVEAQEPIRQVQEEVENGKNTKKYHERHG